MSKRKRVIFNVLKDEWGWVTSTNDSMEKNVFSFLSILNMCSP